MMNSVEVQKKTYKSKTQKLGPILKKNAKNILLEIWKVNTHNSGLRIWARMLKGPYSGCTRGPDGLHESKCCVFWRLFHVCTMMCAVI